MAALLAWETQARTDGSSAAFGAAADYQSVEYTLRELSLPPYQAEGKSSYLHSWTDHRATLAFVVALLVLLLTLYIVSRQKQAKQSLVNDKLQQLNQQLMLPKHR